jgi:hypothetical protein
MTSIIIASPRRTPSGSPRVPAPQGGARRRRMCATIGCSWTTTTDPSRRRCFGTLRRPIHAQRSPYRPGLWCERVPTLWNVGPWRPINGCATTEQTTMAMRSCGFNSSPRCSGDRAAKERTTCSHDLRLRTHPARSAPSTHAQLARAFAPSALRTVHLIACPWRANHREWNSTSLSANCGRSCLQREAVRDE